MGSTLHTYHFHLWKLLQWFLALEDYQALFWRRCRGAIAWGWIFMYACLLSSPSRFCFPFFLFSCGWNIQKIKKNENTKRCTCLICLKSFSRREVIGKLCIGEVRVDLEHLCLCSWKQCRIFHESLCVNNYPLVYILSIIKIMCQALVLGWLDCLFTMCSTKIETLAVTLEFIFFTGKSNGSENFWTLLLYKFFKFSYFI